MIKRIKMYISGNTFLKHVFLLISGTVIAQVISFGVTTILSRMYTEEAFGYLSLVLAISSILSSFTSLKYDTAIVVAETDIEADELRKLSFIISSFLTFCCICVLMLPLPFLKKYDGLVLLIGVLGLLLMWYYIYDNWSIRFKDFSLITNVKIFRSICVFVFQFLCYYLYPEKGLIIGMIIGYLLVILFFEKKRNKLTPF